MCRKTPFREVLLFFCVVWNQFPTLVTQNSKNYSLKVMAGFVMKFELDSFIPPKFHSCKFSITLLPTKFFKLAIGGTALKCKRYKKIYANSFTAS